MVVGDIEDEHDEDATLTIVQAADGTFIADARASLDEVKEALDLDLTGEEGAEDIDTIGGFIVTLAGRVPSRSEVIEGPSGLEFEVLDADPRRVKRLRIHRRTVSSDSGTGEGQPIAPRPESAAAE
jgi:CBS domain containing-hemolysin-like protein